MKYRNPMSSINFSGITDSCGCYADECKYKCCQQDPGVEGEINPGNYLLIYPEELIGETAAMCGHIKIVKDNFNGGSLGFCDAEKIDQSKCNLNTNYKTLDCRSYPFAPAFLAEKLVLIADNRCPVVREKELNRKELDQLYDATLTAWQEVSFKNDKVIKWIKSLHLPSYELYEIK